LHVEEDEVGIELLNRVYRLRTRLAFAEENDVGHRGEESTHAAPRESFVVYYENAHRLMSGGGSL
jgi:hypothetical protein